MPDQKRKPIDYAPTTAEAWDLAHMYARIKRELGLDAWAIGVDPSPVPTPDGRHVYVVYAVKTKLPEQREPSE